MDIVIEDDRIKQIGTSTVSNANNIIDLQGKGYVSAGWIDLHTHCFKKYELYGDDIDRIGYEQGVTTVCDAGTAGSDTIAEFFQQTKDAMTNVFAFINIAKQGISSQNELSDPAYLDKQALRNVCQQYGSFIVGLKARMSKSVVQDQGNLPLDYARAMGDELKLPIMVHIGNEPALLKDVFKRLKAGDIVTHIFNPKVNGILDEEKQIKSFVRSGHEAGVYFDLGHGSESFSFQVCELARAQGIDCDSISTDIYYRNRQQGPVYSLAFTMSKYLQMGYSLETIIDKVTRIPAMMMCEDHLGVLTVGAYADITMFHLEKCDKEAWDAVQVKRHITTCIQPDAVMLRGVYMQCGGERK